MNAAISGATKKASLICILTVGGILIAGFQGIFEPNGRARRVHEAIKPGSNFREVGRLLTGRYVCFFETKTDGQWDTVSLHAFEEADAIQLTGKPDTMRLHLVFLGMSPYRVSFKVELDGNGNVTKVTDPYGWD